MGRGLSPRVRGNPVVIMVILRSMRSIPACAGEPTRPNRWKPLTTVYPRVCGGTRQGGRPSLRIQGLSPRVRGNQEGITTAVPSVRSIPACAGEPRPAAAQLPLDGVYPRVCGGTYSLSTSNDISAGLSPRVRGNLASVGDHHLRQGSIPACAGEPRKPKCPLPSEKVYPRVCGGTGVTEYKKGEDKGLSPRVRGNRNWAGTGPEFRGSIPACAGEPPYWLRTIITS